MDTVFKTDDGIFNYRVAGIYVLKNHVLLHRDINDSHWALPGGRVKITEESQIGLQREYKEELDMNVKVERLLWSVENFFHFNGNPFHEIGFYYLVSSNDDYTFNTEEFFGIEGERLLYKWTSIEELAGISLYPEFLKEALKDIPSHPKHIVVK